MIKIIDDLLTPGYADAIEHDAFNYLFYEYLRKTSVTHEENETLVMQDENTYDDGQMVCPIWTPAGSELQSPFHKYEVFLRPLSITIMDILKTENIHAKPCKIKVNLLRKTNFPENHYNIPHVDYPHSNKISALYYINDTDGDTYIFNETCMPDKLPEKLTVTQRVSPKKNRLVLFPSNRFHASSSPLINQERFVINFIFNILEDAIENS
jgi:hypothetical protein